MGAAQLMASEDAVLDARARVETMVHEAMLTVAKLPDPLRRPTGKGFWPDYPYERLDWGAHEDTSQLKWQPTPRHIDEASVVDWWFSGWRGQDRKRNGIHRWEQALLFLRGWQVVLSDKGSWRWIAQTMEDQPHAPTRSHEWWRNRHSMLMDIAWQRAVALGDVKI